MNKLSSDDITKIMFSIGTPAEGIGAQVANNLIESLKAAETARVEDCFAKAAAQLMNAKKALADYRKTVEKMEARYKDAISAATSLAEKVLQADQDTIEDFAQLLTQAQAAVPAEASKYAGPPPLPSSLPKGLGMAGTSRNQVCTRACDYRA